MSKFGDLLKTKTFHELCRNGEESRAIQYYIQNTDKIDINHLDHFTEKTAIMHSIDDRNHELTAILLHDRRLAPNLQNCFGISALSIAAVINDVDTLFFLIFHGADFNITTADGLNIVHLSILNGHVNIIELMKEYKIPINWNAQDKYGNSPYMLSLGSPDKTFSKILASIPEVDVNLPNYAGKAPADYLQQFEDDKESLVKTKTFYELCKSGE